ncbi:MAG: hypothetical protein KatS3mg061_0452 [Dehalococcoidia bacterium]|nr:MAG: hypothetical protein KatS3mg061_0452 [Dehalococcoidia bacterium]
MIARASTLPLTPLLLLALPAHVLLMGSPLAAGLTATLPLPSSPGANAPYRPEQSHPPLCVHTLTEAGAVPSGGEAPRDQPDAPAAPDVPLAAATSALARAERALGGHPACADDVSSPGHGCHVILPLASPFVLAPPPSFLPASVLPAAGVSANAKGLVATGTPLEYLAFLRILLV